MKALGNGEGVYLRSWFSPRCPVLSHVLPRMCSCGDSHFLQKDQIVIHRNKRNINLKIVTISCLLSSKYCMQGKKMYSHASYCLPDLISNVLHHLNKQIFRIRKNMILSPKGITLKLQLNSYSPDLHTSLSNL